MKYYVRSHTHFRANKPNYTNSPQSFFVLTADGWDDYKYKTTFYFDYFDQGEYKEIGVIKILKKDSYVTKTELYNDKKKLVFNSFQKP